jgi:hypothetical protein
MGKHINISPKRIEKKEALMIASIRLNKHDWWKLGRLYPNRSELIRGFISRALLDAEKSKDND